METLLVGLNLNTIVWDSGRQPPGSGPVPVCVEFFTGPYNFPG